ncbi:hypothetical protein, partial [Escherichia coli]|uniref:hypothetical protein n=1 Tax=Escherichia coli TaxID=562 RepID=UPI0022AEED6E
MVIEYWLSNNAGGSVTANGIAGKVTIRQLAIFKNYIKWRSIWFLGCLLYTSDASDDLTRVD